jgi:hypothetical protein
MPLLVLVGLRKLVILDGVGERLETLGLAVVGEGVVELERERAGLSGDAAERGLGLMELFIGQPGCGGADAGFGLEMLDFEGLLLGSGLGAAREVFADALSVEPTGNAIYDIPGGIGEL